jgi:hypothetical protein
VVLGLARVRSGYHAPGLRSIGLAAAAHHHLLLAHGRAVQAIRAALPAATVGLALNPVPARPATDRGATVYLCTYPIEHMAAVTPELNPDESVSLYARWAPGWSARPGSSLPSVPGSPTDSCSRSWTAARPRTLSGWTRSGSACSGWTTRLRSSP